MISPQNGEVDFLDGLRIGAHEQIETLSRLVVSRRDLPVPGWSHHILGLHPSDHGEFQIEATVSAEQRVEALFLSHRHPFYQPDTPEDSERRAYHEGVIALDLRGQREFQWGHVFCRFTSQVKCDWLVVVYNPFANIPLHAKTVESILAAHEPLPHGAT